MPNAVGCETALCSSAQMGTVMVAVRQAGAGHRPDNEGRGDSSAGARYLAPGPGHAYVGFGTAFRRPSIRRRGTMVVVWDNDQDEPWVVMTDLAPAETRVCWYALRFWIETDFRALKSVGWQWNKTRRTDPERVSRHWLALSVATLLVLAYGTGRRRQ